ncbi:hypothetical protein GH131_10515 [Staphylococcus pseudintermedius]|nr:hypothetical protein [Staphylococcus pseudintermedius]
MSDFETNISKYVKASRVLYNIIKFIIIIMLLSIILFTFIPKAIIKIVSIIFDGDVVYKLLSGLDTLLFNSISKSYGDGWIIHSNNWSEKLSKVIDKNPIDVLFPFIVCLIPFVTVYILIMLYRHHKGEMAPFFNDLESRKIRRKIIRKMDAGYINRSGDNKRKYNKRDAKVKRHLRWHTKVNIHTYIPDDYPMPIKEYKVRIKRARTTEITNRVINKIKDMHTELSAITNGISFAHMKEETNRKFYVFTGGKEVAFKESKRVIKRREEKLAENNSATYINNISSTEEFNFPLEILEADQEKIRQQRAKAEKFASNNQNSIDTLLISMDLQVEPKQPNIGDSAIEYVYETQFSRNVKSSDTIAENVSIELKIKGVTVYRRANELIINVPLPPDKRVPVDGAELIREVHSEGIEDPTHAVIGRSVDNRAMDFIFSTGPHTIIAGATGSGKTVASKFGLISMMAKSTPDELKIQIIDPKFVDFTPFKNSPYNFCDVITDIKNDAVPFLEYLVYIMEERYQTFAEAGGAPNIIEYNNSIEKSGGEKMPYIVVFIDELADLMNQVRKDVEVSIQRLGQKARAAGIHLIVSTQRPSVDVITGTIKANFSGRIALSVKSATDSRIILDESGAEELKGKGDMLVSPSDSEPIRCQGPYITTQQLKEIFEHLNQKFEKPIYPDYQAYVARKKAEEEGTDELEQFEAISSLQQTRQTFEPIKSSMTTEHNRKKSKDEMTSEEKDILNKAMANVKARKEQRKTKSISIDTSRFTTNNKASKPKKVTDKPDKKKSTAEMLGL